MAAPPIQIGELTDVPAFNSPIASPWAQEVSRRVVHRFASTAARDAAYPANTAGQGAMCEVVTTLYISDGVKWVDLARTAAVAVTLESRLLNVITVAGNNDFSITNNPDINSGPLFPPPWSARCLIRTDFMGVYMAAGTAPLQADFQLYLTKAAGGGTLKGRAITIGWSSAQLRTSASWTTYVDGVAANDKVNIRGVIPGGATIRFDGFSTAQFEISWLPN